MTRIDYIRATFHFLRHPRQLLLLFLVPALLVIGGTVGYYIIEDEYTVLDALYMTVITLTTVGYAEVHNLSTVGRMFTILLLLGGVFAFASAATSIIRRIVSGEINELLGREFMSRTLKELNGHLIVCGYGRMGRMICQEFSKRAMPYVLIDRDPELLASVELPHGIPVVGDATADDVLRRAGVDRAKALVTVAASDADNLYITMSARLLNDRLFIVARAEEEQAEQKLKRAGANRVVSPYAIGGYRVAQAVLRPNVVEFIELATRSEHIDLQIEETIVQTGSQLAGSTIQESGVRDDHGVIIVAIKQTQGGMIFNPPGNQVLKSGDTLILLGQREQLQRLERKAAPR